MTTPFQVRLTPTERAELEAAAETAGITLSEYIRRRALGRRVVARRALTDIQTLNELRRLGGLVKHLALEEVGNPDDLRTALAALREAAERVAA
ncbi:plasmid mobilization protein [Acidiphilium cryptum]|uniref:plasmid mobilization protein n=1 Tax=Acidiphilium cryptum TaxID=524 RepID=UPI000680A70E|nr:hypothetical protein [Acidiphilium cryptum]